MPAVSAEQQRVDDAAADDQLDVEHAVADDGDGERDGDEDEEQRRDILREDRPALRIAEQGHHDPGQLVEEDEGRQPDDEAEDDPLDLRLDLRLRRPAIGPAEDDRPGREIEDHQEALDEIALLVEPERGQRRLEIAP